MKMPETTRRGFLAGGAAALCAVCGGCGIAENEAKKGRAYSVPVLGDIHFDSPDKAFYHSLYTHSTTKKRYMAHLAEHVRNAEMWSERMPDLVRASAACMQSGDAFALQLGDLIQGDCGDGNVHKRMLNDAFSFVKQAYGGKLPLLTVPGNHDIRGDIEGDLARETFEKWYPATMAKELGADVQGAAFSFRQGPDVFLFVDFNEPRPDLAQIKKLLEQSEDARYTFIVSHGPVIPSGPSRWFLFGEKSRDEERRVLRSLLARRNAIALCGHTHRTEFIDCTFKEGRIRQFVFNSVWTKRKLAAAGATCEGADSFGGRAFAPDASPEVAAKMAHVAEYRPFVKDYYLSSAAGHYRLEIADSGVKIAFYGGDATSPRQIWRL